MSPQEGVDFLGPVPLDLGTPRLPDRGHHAGDQGRDHQRDGDRGRPDAARTNFRSR